MRIKQLNRALLFVNPNTGATIRMPIVKSQKEALNYLTGEPTIPKPILVTVDLGTSSQFVQTPESSDTSEIALESNDFTCMVDNFDSFFVEDEIDPQIEF